MSQSLTAFRLFFTYHLVKKFQGSISTKWLLFQYNNSESYYQVNINFLTSWLLFHFFAIWKQEEDQAIDVLKGTLLREEIFAGINVREFGFTEDFAEINFCEFSLTKDFAGINFRESALFKDFSGVDLTFAFRNIFSTTLFCGFENNFRKN